jgi:thioredoxin-like negative regulator of GroEL
LIELINIEILSDVQIARANELDGRLIPNATTLFENAQADWLAARRAEEQQRLEALRAEGQQRREQWKRKSDAVIAAKKRAPFVTATNEMETAMNRLWEILCSYEGWEDNDYDTALAAQASLDTCK